MADHIRRALQEEAGDVLLYAPVAEKEEFINAIAYLIRRLDENTAPENFLRHAPGLSVGSDQWQMLKDGFIRSCERQRTLPEAPHRTQNRANEPLSPDASPCISNYFTNEPDTDWSLPVNRVRITSYNVCYTKLLRIILLQSGDSDVEKHVPLLDINTVLGREIAIHQFPVDQSIDLTALLND